MVIEFLLLYTYVKRVCTIVRIVARDEDRPDHCYGLLLAYLSKNIRDKL